MLSIKICKDWASGVLLQRYELVILLLLRCCKQAKCVEDLFPHESEGDKNDIVRELYETEGSKVCFIADGFDELPPESQNSSIFIDLVKKFTDSMIIYTSRPIAAEKLRQQVVGRRIEIIGFKSEQVQEYIEKTLIDLSSQDQQSANVGKEKATELMKLIDSHPFIWKLVHIPINLAIITHIFHLKRSLPLSHSELYTSLVLSTILRYLCERKPVGTRNLDNFDQLPKIERKQFDNVCLLAFQGLQNSKVTFSTRRVRLYNLPDDINGLGLLNFVPFLAEHGTIQSLHFMHLTLQEFCAAFHISKLLKPDQYDAFVKHRDDPTFQVVWQFFAGLNKFTTRRIFASMIPSSNVYSPLYKSDVVQLLLCLYEANANMLCGEAIYFMNGVIDLSYFEMDLLLYTALAYFVSNCSPGSIKVINVGWCGIGDEGLHAISEALMQSYHCDSCAVKLQHKNPLDLDVSYNDLTGAGAHYISKLLSSPCLVGKLVCTGNHKLGDDGVEAIVQSTIGKNTLKILELRRCGIGIKGIKAVGELLKSTSNLETLDISESNIDTKMLTLLSEPFIKNCSLTTLKLKWCTFGQDFNVFVNALSSSSLLNLDLQHSDLSSAGIGRIVHALKRNPYLKSLNLDSTGITDGGVFHISELIAESNSLSELYISNNFQDQGIEGICDTIVKPNSFHTLGIMPCTMSLKEQSSVALSKVLTSASITSLRIIPPENCLIFSAAIASNIILKELEVCGTSVHHFAILLDGIKRNISITKLEFLFIRMEEQWLNDLASMLQVKTNLESLTINGEVYPNNCVVLCDGLLKCKLLKRLKITPYQRIIPSTALKFVTALQTLDSLEVMTLALDIHQTQGEGIPDHVSSSTSQLKLVTKVPKEHATVIRQLECLVSSVNERRHSAGNIELYLHIIDK